jgi:hypothetical protein
LKIPAGSTGDGCSVIFFGIKKNKISLYCHHTGFFAGGMQAFVSSYQDKIYVSLFK